MSILNIPEAHRLRKEHPDWDDLRIVRHIEGMRALRRINEQQRRKQLDDCLAFWSAGFYHDKYGQIGGGGE